MRSSIKRVALVGILLLLGACSNYTKTTELRFNSEESMATVRLLKKIDDAMPRMHDMLGPLSGMRSAEHHAESRLETRGSSDRFGRIQVESSGYVRSTTTYRP